MPPVSTCIEKYEAVHIFLSCALGWTLRYLTPGKPTVFPILPPRENKCFPDPFPVRFQPSSKNLLRTFLCSCYESNRLGRPVGIWLKIWIFSNQSNHQNSRMNFLIDFLILSYIILYITYIRL